MHDRDDDFVGPVSSGTDPGEAEMLTVPKSRTFSTVVAAGVGGFAGMFTYVTVAFTRAMSFAPILGLIVTVAVFSLLSYAQASGSLPPAETALGASTGEEPLNAATAAAPARTRPWLNGLVSWAVCIGVGGAITFDAARVSPDPWMHEHPVYAIGMFFGAVFGFPVAILVTLASWYQNWSAERAARK